MKFRRTPRKESYNFLIYPTTVIFTHTRKVITMERVSKINYYLDIAQTVAERSTCLRRCFGAIIVKNDSIVSTGYNGAPRGRKNCSDLRCCRREELNIPRGQRYELCRSVHAEANAIIAASRENMIGATLYMACIHPETREIMGHVTCCAMCKRQVINAGIDRVIVRENKTEFSEYPTTLWIENDDSLTAELGY